MEEKEEIKKEIKPNPFKNAFIKKQNNMNNVFRNKFVQPKMIRRNSKGR